MPPSPLIRSQRQRDRVIAAIMLCVLLASLAGAYGLTTQRRRPVVELMRVEKGDLSFTLPRHWQEADPPQTPTPSRVAPLRFVDTRRPGRSLMLLRVASPDPVPGEALLPPVTKGLMRHIGFDSVQTVDHETWRREDLLVTEWLGVSPSPAAVHLVANLTRSGRVHWFLYLADQAGEGETAEALLRQDLGLLRSIVLSARLASQPRPDDAPRSDSPPDTPLPRPR